MRTLGVVLLALLVFSGGCTGGNPSEPPLIQGVVLSVEGDRVLVVSGIESPGASGEEWFDMGLDAVWLTVTEKTKMADEKGQRLSRDAIDVGDRVAAWATGPVAESYPAQAEAKRILVLDSPGQ